MSQVCASHSCPPLSLLTKVDIAQRTANWLGVSFHPVVLDETAIATRLEDVVWYTETVIPDANGMGRLAMAEVVHAEGTKVVLSGKCNHS